MLDFTGETRLGSRAAASREIDRGAGLRETARDASREVESDRTTVAIESDRLDVTAQGVEALRRERESALEEQRGGERESPDSPQSVDERERERVRAPERESPRIDLAAEPLDEEELERVHRLRVRDIHVRSTESPAASARSADAAANSRDLSPDYRYEIGPDGRRYAVSGADESGAEPRLLTDFLA